MNVKSYLHYDGLRLHSNSSTAKSVQGAPLTFQSIHNVHGRDRLPLRMLRVGDGVPDNVLEEHLQHAPGLLIDEAADPLDATSPSQAPDSWLRNPLDIITQHLAMSLSAPFPQTLSTFPTSRHVSTRQ